MFVDFYTKSCMYCEKLYPKMNKIIDEFANKRPDIIFMKVDGEDEPNLADDFEVGKYPTLILFRPGDKLYPDKFEYSHSEKEIKAYLDSLVPVKKTDQDRVSNEIDQKLIAALRSRVKELESMEANKGNMTSVELKDLIASHEKSMNRSITKLRRNLRNFKKTQETPIRIQVDHSATTPTPTTPTPDADDDQADADTDYSYQHSYWVKLGCFICIGCTFGLIYERHRALNHAKHKLATE